MPFRWYWAASKLPHHKNESGEYHIRSFLKRLRSRQIRAAFTSVLVLVCFIRVNEIESLFRTNDTIFVRYQALDV